MQPKTMFEKVWNAHLVKPETEQTPAVLYIDLHLLHEVTSPQAFQMLREKGLSVRQPKRAVATMDHATPSLPKDGEGNYPFVDLAAKRQVETLVKNCETHGIQLHELGSAGQGIVHVIGPEMGLTHPGATIVCGDSHTSTHGAFGALAFGIGTSEVGHVLATQCLLQRKPKTMSIEVRGRLNPGVTAKDLILAIIAEIGVDGGLGHVIEFRGEAIEALSMESRMTLCNMSIEAGARAGMVAPDQTTFSYLQGRQGVPKDEAWQQALAKWRTLPSDPGAVFDAYHQLDAHQIRPMITYGTNPEMAIPVGASIPASQAPNQVKKALAYMNFKAGERLVGKAVDVVFIGSCTNSRISDLRQAAEVFRDKKVAPGLRALIVPGSRTVKNQAEDEGLDQVFLQAGAEWREPSCSMCIAMNGDQLAPGQLAVSTSNRNFEGRQGPGGRTLLASPATAAATAINGYVTNPEFLEEHVS